MNIEAAKENSGLNGSWGKTNLIGPSVEYLSVRFVHALTGTLNPASGLLMGVVSSVVDVAAGIITKGSSSEADTYFRLAATTIVPLSLGMFLGLSFASSLTMTLINLIARLTLFSYVFEAEK